MGWIISIIMMIVAFCKGGPFEPWHLLLTSGLFAIAGAIWTSSLKTNNKNKK